MQVVKGHRFDKAETKDSIIEKTKYDDCTFFNISFNKVTWNKCHFHNTSILGNSILEDCKFIDCKFTGQHTNMGTAKYMNCEFENVSFKNIQFWGATFLNCVFSGQAYNIVFYGNESPQGWETKFENVNIKHLNLDMVDFRCNFDLTKTIR